MLYRLAVGVILLGLAGCQATKQPDQADNTQEPLNIHIDTSVDNEAYLAGQLAAQFGDHTTAIKQLTKADSEIRNQYGNDSLDRIHVLKALFASYSQTGQRQDSHKTLLEITRLTNHHSDAWAPETADGFVKHKQSGVIFPKQIGQLIRVRKDVLLLDGTDVAITYEANNRKLTLYVTEIPNSSFNQEYQSAYQSIQHLTPTIKSENVRNFQVRKGDKSYAGKLASFRFTNPNGYPIRTQLGLVKIGDQFVKVRFSFPFDHSQQASKEFQELLNTISWP